jgi:ketosteroid isomerase-like protein
MTGLAAVAQRYADAVDRADDAALRALHTPDARIWHNTDGLEQTLEENLKVGAWLRRKAADLAFTEVRITLTADGFVRRHRMTGTGPGGAFDVPSCLVVTVEGDRISRVEEYIDSAGLAPITAAAG